MKLSKLGDGPEIFHTLQGEGASVGLPAVFVRASRCNLHCIWCDTDHTWNFTGTPWPHEKDSTPGYSKHVKQDVTVEITPAEAAARVLAYRCHLTVITGGEPLLQEGAFLEMIGEIRHTDPTHHIEVETNGTRIPSPAFYQAVNQFNVSPKLANAAMPAAVRLQPEALKFFARSPKAWFKFVVSSTTDLEEIDTLLATYEIPNHHVILMPQGRTTAELDAVSQFLADHCRQKNFRFSDRLHIRLWGDRQGV